MNLAWPVSISRLLTCTGQILSGHQPELVAVLGVGAGYRRVQLQCGKATSVAWNSLWSLVCPQAAAELAGVAKVPEKHQCCW